MASTTRQDRGLGSTASTFVKDLIAGGVSGVVAKTIGELVLSRSYSLGCESYYTLIFV
jgi:hypothetical protein